MRKNQVSVTKNMNCSGKIKSSSTIIGNSPPLVLYAILFSSMGMLCRASGKFYKPTFLDNKARQHIRLERLTPSCQAKTKQAPSLHLLLLRGGASKDDEDKVDDLEEDPTYESKSSLWGSVNSAFQMNIDAKNELMHETESNDETTVERNSDFNEDPTTQEKNSNEEIVDGGNIDFVDEYDVTTDDLEIESGFIEIRQTGVATASSRLIHAGTEGDEEESEIDEHIMEYIGSESPGNAQSENPGNIDQSEVLIEGKDESDDSSDAEEIVTATKTNGSDNVDELINAIETDSSSNTEEIVTAIESCGSNDTSEIDDATETDNGTDAEEVPFENVGSNNIEKKVTSTAIESVSDIEEIITKTEAHDVSSSDVIDEAVDLPSRPDTQIFEGSLQAHDLPKSSIQTDNLSLYTQIDSTSDSETLPEEVGYDEGTSTVTPTFEEIVREEWSMVPETEVEDEGRENELGGEVEEERPKHKKKKNRSNNKPKAKKKNKDKNKKKRQNAQGMTGQINNREREQGKKSVDLNALPSPNEKILKEMQPFENIPVPIHGINSIEAKQSSDSPLAESPYISSGYWTVIDKVSSMGLSSTHETLRVSRKLRSVRKMAAYYTGLHGILSGKGKDLIKGDIAQDTTKELNEKELGAIRRRLAAIETARKRVASATSDITAARQSAYARIPRWRRPLARLIRRPGNVTSAAEKIVEGPTAVQLPRLADDSKQQGNRHDSGIPALPESILPQQKPSMTDKEKQRVQEIDRMIQEGQKHILELQIEKDELQQSPNPLYNYTTPSAETETVKKDEVVTNSRTFIFPSEKLVSEYIDELVSMRRLQMMNHTDLWKQRAEHYSDDDEGIGDDILTPSGDAKKLYENFERKFANGRRNNHHVGGGSWLLRQTLGAGASLGEKIGGTIENAAYKGVCSVLMAILARSISALHGVNVMKHSDIRLFVESAPDLPPVSKTLFEGNDYAKEAIGKAIRKGSRKKRKRREKAYQYGSGFGDATFVQRDAVVETLISHCQISAPLLKLFPQAWQRALIGNIITLIAAVMSDFAEGLQFQILGHQLSFSFKPITEADMIQHIGIGGFRFNHRRAKPEEFEAAVRATADDVSQDLGFLGRWHERILGGDLLRAQIGNLIARVVLTLVDEVLHSARMDLWSAQVGGPRIVAGLEYRSDDD